MPKRLPPDQRRDHQALIRLTKDQHDWLDAAAFLGRVGTSEYIYGVLVAHVSALRSNAHVSQAVDLRQAHDAATSETVPLTQPPAGSSASRAESGSA